MYGLYSRVCVVIVVKICMVMFPLFFVFMVLATPVNVLSRVVT